jgi:glycosyltransferase involved in cell wall biosynthesis
MPDIMNLRVNLSSIGRFHFFALAVELARIGVLEKLYTGYPAKMVRKAGVPADRIATFPWLSALGKAIPGRLWPTDAARRAYTNLSHEAHDRWVAANLRECEIFHGLSRYNLKAGIQAKKLGARYICEVGSSHILEHRDIADREHSRVGLPLYIFHPLDIERELAEYEEADRIIVLSSFALNSFVKRGIPKEKLICLPPGVNVTRFKAERNSESETFRVVFVGHITVRKGVHILAEAFKKASLKNSELVLAGGVPPAMKALIDSIGAPNVRFLGNVPNADLPSLYGGTSVFVLPSFEDGFGLVALEAMASGCPVIISSSAGAADIVDNGVTGYIVPAGDVDAIADRLELIYRNPTLAAEMGLRAAESARRVNSWAQYGDRMAEVYRHLIDSR